MSGNFRSFSALKLLRMCQKRLIQDQGALPSTSPWALIELKYNSTTSRLMSCCTEVAGEKQVRPVHGRDKKTLMETVCDLVETVRSS